MAGELDAIARDANEQLLAGFSEQETARLSEMLQRLTANSAAR